MFRHLHPVKENVYWREKYYESKPTTVVKLVHNLQQIGRLG